jgi:hypothetical protein
VSPRFARAGRIPKPRLVLVSVFVAASSLAAVVASYGSAAPAKAGPGFWLASSSGVVKAFGGAGQFGSLKTPGSGPVVGIAPTPDAGGYWLATAKGQVFGFGDAKVYGSMATRHLAKPIVGITGAPDGRGYWLFGGDGGVFSFGDARYLGSAGRAQLGSAVVAMAVAPGAKGYWLATRAGAVLRFGAVPRASAPAATPLGSAVAAMAATPDAKGYWLVTTKGKVVAFGDAHSYGSMTGALKASIVGIAPTANGKGYWLAARDGAVFAFGDAHQAVAGRPAAPQAQGPVSAIALSFNAGHLRARTVPVTSTTATVASAAGTGTTAATGAAVGIGAAASPGAPAVPATTTARSATTMVTPTTTAGRSTTPATSAGGNEVGSPGNCTSPVWSTSDAHGTDNLDPTPAPEYWWMDNDAWSGGAGPQAINVCNQQSWYAVSDQTNQQGQVETYPNSEFDVGGRANGVATQPISAYNSITSTFSENFPSLGSWDAAYDLWLNNWGTEIMIWNQWTGTQLFWPSDKSITVDLDGVPYWFQNNGGELMFFRQTMVQSGSVDILAALNWLAANGYVKSSDVPTQFEYGVEICATSGTETFPLTGLTFNMN